MVSALFLPGRQWADIPEWEDKTETAYRRRYGWLPEFYRHELRRWRGKWTAPDPLHFARFPHSHGKTCQKPFVANCRGFLVLYPPRQSTNQEAWFRQKYRWVDPQVSTCRRCPAGSP